MTNIHFSQAALEHISKLITEEHSVGMRLSIKKTGCSGYSYLPCVIHEVHPGDEVLEIAGVKIFIDSQWAHLLQNVHVDYLAENKSGLKQKKLVFINPNETSRCGCGESFHVE